MRRVCALSTRLSVPVVVPCCVLAVLCGVRCVVCAAVDVRLLPASASCIRGVLRTVQSYTHACHWFRVEASGLYLHNSHSFT